MSKDIEVNEYTFMYSNGMLTCYKDGDKWRFSLIIKGEAYPSEDHYENLMCAKSNGRGYFKELTGQELRLKK